MASIGQKYEAGDQLKGVISHFYVIRTPDNAATSLHHLAPNLEMMVVFNFGAPVCFSSGEKGISEHVVERIGILGPLRRMMNYELKPGSDLIVLQFIFDGFYRLLHSSPENLDKAVHENDLITHTQRLEHIWQTLDALTDPDERVRELSNYLINAVSGSEAATIPLLEGVAAIHDNSINPVKVIAGKAALSDRSVQIRFRKYGGYSPKELLRFLRFKKVLATVTQNRNREKNIDWFDLIVEHNYHDQSHLIKDFNYFTGVSPKRFLKLSDEEQFCISRD